MILDDFFNENNDDKIAGEEDEVKVDVGNIRSGRYVDLSCVPVKDPMNRERVEGDGAIDGVRGGGLHLEEEEEDVVARGH